MLELLILSTQKLTYPFLSVQAMTLDQETAEQLRKEMASKKGSSDGKSGGKKRGPVDSGKGVRIQVISGAVRSVCVCAYVACN